LADPVSRVALPYAPPIDIDNALAKLARVPIRLELAHRGAKQVVSLPVLVHQPECLAWMRCCPGRVLRADHQIDRHAIRLRQIEQPPAEGSRQQAVRRIPGVW